MVSLVRRTTSVKSVRLLQRGQVSIRGLSSFMGGPFRWVSCVKGGFCGNCLEMREEDVIFFSLRVGGKS